MIRAQMVAKNSLGENCTVSGKENIVLSIQYWIKNWLFGLSRSGIENMYIAKTKNTTGWPYKIAGGDI